MSIDDKLFEIGGDVTKTTAIMDMLGFDIDEIDIPVKFKMLKETIEFFGQFENGEYMLRKVCIGKPGDRLNYAWDYSQLYKKRDLDQKQLDEVNEARDVLVKFIETKDIEDHDSMERFKGMTEQKENLEKSIEATSEQMDLFS